MNTDYKLLIKQAEALVQGVPHLTANLANISALLYTSLEDINWAGFYLTEGSMLVLGPFQGNPACVPPARKSSFRYIRMEQSLASLISTARHLGDSRRKT